MTREQFTESLRKLHQAQWQAMVPRNKASLEKFKKTMLPAWRHTMELDSPENPPEVQAGELKKNGEYTTAKITIKPCTGGPALRPCIGLLQISPRPRLLKLW